MAAKALLDGDPDPSEESIKKALSRNLCRCTGYRKIIEAVKLAGRFLRKETSPEFFRPDLSRGLIGVSLPRPTAYLRACGTAQFTADLPLEQALHLAAVRSPHHHARIISIETGPALALSGVVGVMTAKDIRGTNRIKYLVADQPVLCDRKVRSSVTRWPWWRPAAGRRPWPVPRRFRLSMNPCRRSGPRKKPWPRELRAFMRDNPIAVSATPK